jgi:hypothetical protein
MDLTQIRDIVFRKTKGLTSKPDVFDIDDALSMTHNTYIQPAAKIPETADYVTTAENETVKLASIAEDIYRIDSVQDVTGSDRGPNIALLNTEDTQGYGVRREGDTVYFQGIGSGVKVRFRYQKKLKMLGTGEGQVTTPEIDERWHDLYWLGVVAMLDFNAYPFFQDRLSMFESERDRELRPRGRRIKARAWG